jgi:small-conductance mechanosensitive channel
VLEEEPERSGSSPVVREAPGNISAEAGLSQGHFNVTLTRAGRDSLHHSLGASMNNIIYIVGLIVVVLAILSFLGLR